jgi:hypothetical protein
MMRSMLLLRRILAMWRGLGVVKTDAQISPRLLSGEVGELKSDDIIDSKNV